MSLTRAELLAAADCAERYPVGRGMAWFSVEPELSTKDLAPDEWQVLAPYG